MSTSPVKRSLSSSDEPDSKRVCHSKGFTRYHVHTGLDLYDYYIVCLASGTIPIEQAKSCHEAYWKEVDDRKQAKAEGRKRSNDSGKKASEPIHAMLVSAAGPKYLSKAPCLSETSLEECEVARKTCERMFKTAMDAATRYGPQKGEVVDLYLHIDWINEAEEDEDEEEEEEGEE